MSKQDGYASRTAADLERKYNFGKTFSEVYGLVSDARKIAEDAQNAFAGLNQDQIFNLLTNFGQAQGIYRDDTGDVYVNASYIKSGKLSAEYIDTTNLIVSAGGALSTDIPKSVSQLVNDLGYQTRSGVVEIVGGVVTADYVNALGLYVEAANINGKLVAGQIDATNLKVSAANITGTLTIGQLPSTIAETSDIPTDTGDLSNNAGYVKETGVVSIINGTVTADYVNSLNLKVNAANITGTLTIGQLPSSVAETSDIPTQTSQLYNNSGFVNTTGVVNIVEGTVTADYVNALRIRATRLQGQHVDLLDSWGWSIGGIEIVDTSSGDGLNIYTNYYQGGIRIEANGGNVFLRSGNSPQMLLGYDSGSYQNVISLYGGALLVPTEAYGRSLPASGANRQVFFLLS